MRREQPLLQVLERKNPEVHDKCIFVRSPRDLTPGCRFSKLAVVQFSLVVVRCYTALFFWNDA
jgi:hypothetical protein